MKEESGHGDWLQAKALSDRLKKQLEQESASSPGPLLRKLRDVIIDALDGGVPLLYPEDRKARRDKAVEAIDYLFQRVSELERERSVLLADVATLEAVLRENERRAAAATHLLAEHRSKVAP